jgi:hypothetical protein
MKKGVETPSLRRSALKNEKTVILEKNWNQKNKFER